MGFKIITPIATEPITLAQVKAHLRLDLSDTSEDNQLTQWISAAREYGETYTRRAFATQTVEMTLDSFPYEEYIELSRAPLQSVTSVIYKDYNAVETTFTDYIVDIDNEPGKVILAYGKPWPSFTPYPANAVRIRYVCGYDNTRTIPKIFVDAMLFHVGLFYKYRDEGIPKEYTDSLNRLYYPHRIFNF